MTLVEVRDDSRSDKKNGDDNFVGRNKIYRCRRTIKRKKITARRWLNMQIHNILAAHKQQNRQW